ncbi:hypothetical protein ACF3NF_04785 [Anaerococcus martiniensis]|uniref:hypothetical protein n=1 Tax=Anaerococcus sp. WGS1579 TaxID=3366809 RepID=UPI00372D544A
MKILYDRIEIRLREFEISDDDFEKRYNSDVNLAIEEFDERHPEVYGNDNIFDVKFENIEVEY